jgi:uncharacterized C2H2 Zn-finger protein
MRFKKCPECGAIYDCLDSWFGIVHKLERYTFVQEGSLRKVRKLERRYTLTQLSLNKCPECGAGYIRLLRFMAVRIVQKLERYTSVQVSSLRNARKLGRSVFPVLLSNPVLLSDQRGDPDRPVTTACVVVVHTELLKIITEMWELYTLAYISCSNRPECGAHPNLYHSCCQDDRCLTLTKPVSEHQLSNMLSR